MNTCVLGMCGCQNLGVDIDLPRAGPMSYRATPQINLGQICADQNNAIAVCKNRSAVWAREHGSEVKRIARRYNATPSIGTEGRSTGLFQNRRRSRTGALSAAPKNKDWTRGIAERMCQSL